MPQFLTDLYSKNKVLAWIVGLIILPAIILFIFKDFAMMFLAKGAQKDIDNAVAKDKEIQKEVDSIKSEAATHEAKAQELDQKANALKDDKDEDWQKNRGSVFLMTLAVLVLISVSSIFLMSAYREHFPIARAGDCVVTDEGYFKVVENNISEGSMVVEYHITVEGASCLSGHTVIEYAKARSLDYYVSKGCTDEVSN